jgi:hypothetical protein
MDGIEKSWTRFVKYLGIALPENLTKAGLDNWARPEVPHPARKNRPFLLELLIRAREGSLEAIKHQSINVPEGDILLSSVPEFMNLVDVQKTNPDLGSFNLVLSWIEQTISSDIAMLVREQGIANMKGLTQDVDAYLAIEQKMYEKSFTYLEQFLEESKRLERVKQAIDIPTLSDRKQRLEHLSEYMDIVLKPLVEIIETNEKARNVYLDAYKRRVADVVMQTAGIAVEALILPSFDTIYELIDDMPKFNEAEHYQAWKTSAAFVQVENEMEKKINQINAQFGTHIDLKSNDIAKNLRNGTINLQINNCFGGEMKSVLQNNETHLTNN